jgi:CO dehydrogenase maturation factor
VVVSTIIAVSGKGGSGKTTTAALIVKYLISRGVSPVFAVDADPNSNLAEQLGVEEYGTVGSIREELSAGREPLPAGMSKPDYIRYRIQETVSESHGFDLLTMGRPEGPGCYCYVNSLLRDYLDSRSQAYPSVVIDNEAGMEHLSRRTTRDVDLLLIVCDATAASLSAALRIGTLARGLDLRIRETGVVLNRASTAPQPVIDKLQKGGLSVLGAIPEDPQVMARALAGDPLLGIDEGSAAFAALSAILDGVLSAATTAGVLRGRGDISAQTVRASGESSRLQ